MSMIGKIVISAWMILLASCVDTPSEPNWIDDIRPVLAANCIRCHSTPSIGGAPNTFRLDVYEDDVDENGTLVRRGAGTMAQFLAARVSAGEMPPPFALTPRQQDMIVAWADRAAVGQRPPKGESRGTNTEPDVLLLNPLEESIDGETATFWLDLVDPDGDLLSAFLEARQGESSFMLARNISGRSQQMWDVGTVAAGDYEIVATVEDGTVVREVSLGTLNVSHPDNNAAPSVSILAPESTVIADLDSPAELAVVIDDAQAADALTLRVEAIRGTGDTVLISDAAALRGANTISWDTAGLPPGTYRIVATASDGQEQRSAVFDRIIVSHATTNLRFDDVELILARHCAVCHPGLGDQRVFVPGLVNFLTNYGGPTGAYSLRAKIYTRVVLQQNMPPASARLLDAKHPGPLSEDDRSILGEWILAGAPE
jgi:mono/diheme cytochrome c family protein